MNEIESRRKVMDIILEQIKDNIRKEIHPIYKIKKIK